MDNTKPATFLSRDQLAFQEGTTFQLSVSHTASTLDRFFVTGATKEGPFTFTIESTNDEITQTALLRIPDVPIWISVQDNGGAFGRGRLFVRVNLSVNGNILQQLVAGYVFTPNALTWPQVSIQNPTPFIGRVQTMGGTDPAAGAEISETVPAGEVWHLRAIRFTLVTSATAATRVVHLRIADGSNVYFECIANASQTASLTRQYSGQPTQTTITDTTGTEIIIPIPANLYLNTGWTISTVTTALQAGDNYQAPTMLIENFIIG